MRFRVSIVLGLWALCASVPANAEPSAKFSPRDRFYDVAGHAGSLFVVGHPGRLLRSNDGGKSFETLDGGQGDQALFAIAFNSKGLGAIVGRSGMVVLSSDGGKSWTSTQVTFDDEHPSLFGVEVLEDGTIVAVGEFGNIVRSEDGGKTFTRVKYTVDLDDPGSDEADQAPSESQKSDARAADTEPRPECPDLESVAEANIDVIDEARLADVMFLDDKRGFIVGEFGLMLATSDGGRSFARRDGCAGNFLYNLAQAPEDTVYAVGFKGSAVRSTDGGQTWFPVKTGTEEDLYTVSVAGDDVMLAGALGTLYVGTTQGSSFERVSTGVYTWLVSSWLGENGKGLLVGGRATILRTEDAGHSTERMTFGE